MSEDFTPIKVGDEWMLVHAFMQPDAIFGPHTAQADVYDSVRWENTRTGEVGHAFLSKTTGGVTHDEVNDDCRLMFTMTCRHPGCWDERVYTKEEEYWDGELMQMALAEDYIKHMLRSLLRSVKNIPTEE
jgi:hypothetical protein